MKKYKKSKNIKDNKPNFDYLILLVFLISIIVPIIVASSQQYITQYGDDIAFISWAKDNHLNPLSVFDKLGTGYRPLMLTWLFIIYNIFGSDPFYYYLLSGILFSGAMVFLYLLGKTLHSRRSGLIAVLLYLFLDGTFIMVSKFNFIAFTGEIFFITSALYFSINYFKTNNRKYMWIAIILSIFSFISKEPSLLIIPFVNLTYLYFNKKLNYKNIILNIIPFIYMFIIMFFIAPEVGTGTNVNIIERIISNLKFYTNNETEVQFKTPILLGISILIGGYYFYIKKFRAEIVLCSVWFIVGLLPFLITNQIVQNTYMIEANIGMVLLIGIVISETSKIYDKITPIIPILLIIGILFQSTFIPEQISNMKNYNRMISDNQNTFLETVESLKQISNNETVFYFSDEIRQKYRGMQLVPDFFRQYLCIRNLCDIKMTTNYSEANYIILPSSLDIYIYQKEYPSEKPKIIKQIKNGNDYGYLLHK